MPAFGKPAQASAENNSVSRLNWGNGDSGVASISKTYSGTANFDTGIHVVARRLFGEGEVPTTNVTARLLILVRY